MAYQERLLLFTNEAAVGIFNVENSSISIALSANGEFIKLFTGKSSTVHLTRFCPSHAHNFVRKVLLFRNKYAKQPYLCDRFHKAVSSVFVNSKTLHWKRNYERSFTTSSGWKVYQHSDDQAAFAICPHNKRLCYISEAIYVQDAAIGLHRTSTSIAEHLALSQLTVVPLQSAPLYFQRKESFSDSSSDSNEFDDQECEVPVPISIPSGASDSSSACKFFNEIEHEINILKSISRYPTTLAFALKVEEIDGEIFLCTDPGTFIRNLNFDYQNFSSEPESSLTVETWISKKSRNMDIENGNEYESYLSSSQLDLEGLEHSGLGCNADGPVLQLRGDYFTFFSLGMHGLRFVALPPIVMHASLLDSLNSRRIENDNIIRGSQDNVVSEFEVRNMKDMRGDGSERKAASNISTPLHVYRNAAVRLLAYREYLLDRERSLRMFHWEPYCLRVITRTSPKNIPGNSIDFDKIRSSDRGVSSDKGRGKDREEGIDGSKRVTLLHAKLPKLYSPRISDCPSSSSVKDDILPLQLTTKSGTRLTAYPVLSLKGSGNINLSGNDEVYDDAMKGTGNHGSYIIPNSSRNYGYLDDEMDDESGLNKRKYFKIRGVFTDRTQINFCLHTQVRPRGVEKDGVQAMYYTTQSPSIFFFLLHFHSPHFLYSSLHYYSLLTFSTTTLFSSTTLLYSPLLLSFLLSLCVLFQTKLFALHLNDIS